MRLYLAKGAEYNDALEVVSWGLHGNPCSGDAASDSFEAAFDEAMEVLYPETESMGEAQDMIEDYVRGTEPERYSEH